MVSSNKPVCQEYVCHTCGVVATCMAPHLLDSKSLGQSFHGQQQALAQSGLNQPASDAHCMSTLTCCAADSTCSVVVGAGVRQAAKAVCSPLTLAL